MRSTRWLGVTGSLHRYRNPEHRAGIPGTFHRRLRPTSPIRARSTRRSQQHVSTADRDRETVRRFMQRDDVKQMAGKAGLDHPPGGCGAGRD